MSAKKRNASSERTFVFRKHQVIGAADAFDDKEFLRDSFVDNGELNILIDTRDPRCVVVGRTGSGKTALLEMLGQAKDNVIRIAPEDLALNYVAGSDVLRFFIKAGVNMDLFYRLLWRHVFAVEIIRRHYRIVDQETQRGFLAELRQRLTRDERKRRAVDYLLTWGESFWLESEFRVKEITKTLEDSLSKTAELGVNPSIPGVGGATVKLSTESAQNLTEEQRAEIVSRGQEVVNKVQMRDLADVMRLLNDLLDDKQKVYYLAIDRLDENWVSDEFRYHLVKALIDTARDFNNSVSSIKIIIAIRRDLIDRVFRYARSSGYQEEKYNSMYLEVSWNQKALEALLDKRVNAMIRDQYTTKEIRARELFPELINKDDPIKYFIDRTLLRPRDVIVFFNECMGAATGKPKLTQATIVSSEAIYSEKRLRALADEWAADYMNLVELVLFLRNYPSTFSWGQMVNDLGNCMLEFLIGDHPKDPIYHLVLEGFNNGEIGDFAIEMTKLLFMVGVLGVKPASYSPVKWSSTGNYLHKSEIDLNSSIHIHPAFWKVLAIRPSK